MPTYEYACSSCQNAWEFEQSIKDDAITECPACHKQTAKRQISRGGGFILKGGGWYADAYSSGSNAKPGSTPAPTMEGTTKTSVTLDKTGEVTKTVTKTAADGSTDSNTKTTPPPPAT